MLLRLCCTEEQMHLVRNKYYRSSLRLIPNLMDLHDIRRESCDADIVDCLVESQAHTAIKQIYIQYC